MRPKRMSSTRPAIRWGIASINLSLGRLVLLGYDVVGVSEVK